MCQPIVDFKPIKSSLRSSDSSVDGSSTSSTSSSVDFTTTQIHYFGVSLGCNPCARGGPPVELGHHISTQVIDTCRYELMKSAERRRPAAEFCMDKHERRSRLIETHSTEEISECEREMRLIQKQRQATRRQDKRIKAFTSVLGMRRNKSTGRRS